MKKRRMLAGLVALTTPLGLAFASPAAADYWLLRAGLPVQVAVAPGGTALVPATVTNIGTTPMDGVGLAFGGIYGYESVGSFANCLYSINKQLEGCRFDQVLEPGKSYTVDLPLRVPADALAPGSMTSKFDWHSGRNYDLIYGGVGYTAGTGEALRLTETTVSATAPTVWQDVAIDVTGSQGADLGVSGGKAYGAAGDVVKVAAGVRNNGPGGFHWLQASPARGKVVVTIPPGTSVVSAQGLCKPETEAKVRYVCDIPSRFAAGDSFSWPFNLRIDQVVPDATGTIAVDFDGDLATANDTAQLVINPAPTAPGGTDTNPPVVTATGLTEGQLVGWFQDVTPSWSDDVAVTKVQVLVNGVVTETYQGTLPRQVMVELPSSAHNKDARITIRAFDAAGNSGERSTTVKADVLSPDATISPAFGSRLRGVVTFRATNVSADTARIEVVDQSGKIVARSTAAPWTASWDTRKVSGNQAVTVRVFDRAGNVSFDWGSYTVDNTGPSVSSITPGNKALVRGSVRTTIKATDPSGLKSVRVTGGKATSSPYIWTVTPKAQGNHTIEWVLTDKLGNTTIARRVVVNDTVAPALKLTKAPKNNAKLKKTTTITASASDKNGVAKVQLLVNGKVVATDAKAAYTFKLNPKKYGKKFTVQLRAYDKAGNVKTLAKRTYRR
jgi:hypothetical protein